MVVRVDWKSFPVSLRSCLSQECDHGEWVTIHVERNPGEIVVTGRVKNRLFTTSCEVSGDLGNLRPSDVDLSEPRKWDDATIAKEAHPSSCVDEAQSDEGDSSAQ